MPGISGMAGEGREDLSPEPSDESNFALKKLQPGGSDPAVETTGPSILRGPCILGLGFLPIFVGGQAHIFSKYGREILRCMESSFLRDDLYSIPGLHQEGFGQFDAAGDDVIRQIGSGNFFKQPGDMRFIIVSIIGDSGQSEIL